VNTGKLLNSLAQQASVNQAHFSPNGQMVVTAGQDGTARVMDAATGALRVILAGHRGAVLDANFSPDGRTIATVSRDGTARLWDATTGTEESLMRPLQANGQTVPLTQAIFSKNGQYLATLADNGQMYLWATSWDGLLQLARARSVGQLKPTECLRYLRLPPSACPIIEARK
jgi:WD40 repeat protein